MPSNWRSPLSNRQQGWGHHRLDMIWHITDCSPVCSATNVPLKTELSFSFPAPLDFKGTKNKTIRLYRVQDPKNPVWTADPEPADAAQGQKTITFDQLPTLEPSTTYFLLTDPGWAKMNGQPLLPLNDGAFWYRFRTAPAKFSLKPGSHTLISPKPTRTEGDRKYAYAQIYFRKDEEIQPFFTSTWRFNEDARSMVFFYHDPKTKQLRLHGIRDYLP